MKTRNGRLVSETTENESIVYVESGESQRRRRRRQKEEKRRDGRMERRKEGGPAD
jgi:hypothetical protein